CKSDQTVETKPDAQVLNVIAHDVSPPLRELAMLPRRAPREELETEPPRQLPMPHMKKASEIASTDPVVQAKFGPTAIAPTAKIFEAQGAGLAGFTNVTLPSDADGDIGLNDYVQVVNLSLAVFDRTGKVKMGPMDTSTLWSGFPGG